MQYYDDIQRFKEKTGVQHAFRDFYSGRNGHDISGWLLINRLSKVKNDDSVLSAAVAPGTILPVPVGPDYFALQLPDGSDSPGSRLNSLPLLHPENVCLPLSPIRHEPEKKTAIPEGVKKPSPAEDVTSAQASSEGQSLHSLLERIASCR